MRQWRRQMPGAVRPTALRPLERTCASSLHRVNDFDSGWARAIDLGIGPEPAAETVDERQGIFSRMREGLGRTRKALSAELGASFGEKFDSGTWESLEELLVLADVGVPTTAKVIEQLEQEAEAGSIVGIEGLRERLIQVLAEVAQPEGVSPRMDLSARPSVVMVVGVNGTGKTTSIGKLAHVLSKEAGLKVVLAAADTYRAAAVEQLSEWAERAGCEIVKGADGGDPGAVAFDGIAAAEARNADVMICDTAGRLHTHSDLMAELVKVRRVISDRAQGAPHETLVVIDATTGQNGVRQAKEFAEAVEVTGVVLTKLDGSSKGGVALAVASELGIPVKLVGIGESLEDLRPFDALEFSRALVGE